MKNLGFSLIELLVSISILVVLSTIGFINFRTVSQKSRDSRRLSDLEQIRGGLELYRSDANQYPSGLYSVGGCTNSTLSYLGNIYIQRIPCDPERNVQYQYYRNAASPLRYYLGATLDFTISSPVNCSSIVGFTSNYCIANP